MMRAQKDVDWGPLVHREDLFYLRNKVEPADWYPMETFERFGNAILSEVANGSLDAVRMWGRLSVDALHASMPALVAKGDPIETMMRFRVQRATYFDFDALAISTLTHGHAEVVIHYFMGAKAEEAASYQTMGFFERLLELAGAQTVSAKFTSCSWTKGARTLLVLDWYER